MLRNFIKKLPIINLWHQSRQLTYRLNVCEKQLIMAVEQLESLQLRSLMQTDKLSNAGGKVIDAENNYNSEQQVLSKCSTDDQIDGLVVSLTSYGYRVKLVHHTILSLLIQTKRAEKVILWLAEDEYSPENIPSSLAALQAYGLEIGYCKDIRSYKKLIPTLKAYPEHTIITVDDDVIYPSDHIEKLYEASKKYPDTVICHLAHRVAFEEGNNERQSTANIASYKNWPTAISNKEPAVDVFPVGMGGVLYPVNCLDEEVLNEEAFTKLCPHADDIWFKLMAHKKGTLSKVLDEPMALSEYLHIPDSQQSALWHVNYVHNDVQLAAALKAYPDLKLV